MKNILKSVSASVLVSLITIPFIANAQTCSLDYYVVLVTTRVRRLT